MKPPKFLTWPSVLAVLIVSLIFAGVGVADAMAQETIKVFITTDSFTGAKPGVRVEIGPHSTTTDSAGKGELTIAPGNYYARATASCAVVRVTSSQSAPMVGGTPQVPLLAFKVGALKTANVTFLCGSQPPNSVHVKIATTRSCAGRPTDPVSKAEDVSVTIGENAYKTDINGVTEVDLPQGTYPVNGSLRDTYLGFVARNGNMLAKDANGGYTVNLSDRVVNLEIRMFTCDETGQGKPRAVIMEIGGSVRVMSGNTEKKGSDGMRLRDGDTVVINGKTKLKWLEGNGIISFDDRSTIIRIGPGEAPAGSVAPPKRSMLEILKGVGSFFVPHQDDSEFKFAASTNSAIAAIGGRERELRQRQNQPNPPIKQIHYVRPTNPSGQPPQTGATLFSLSHDDQTHVTTVIVQEGAVYVEPTNSSLRPFDLVGGQRAEISPNGVNGPNQPAGQSGPTVRTNKSAYAPNERIDVTFSNPAGHGWDHITIARPVIDGDQSNVGSSAGSTKWKSYIDQERSGTKTFDGLAEGQYEARYISWDNGNNRATARISFTVGNAPPPPPSTGGPPTNTGGPPPTAGNPPATGNSSDLSGFWVDDTGGGAVYRIRQLGNKLYWTVDGTSKGEYVNVFHGEITGNMIDGEWLDMPGSPLRPALVAATLGLRIESNDRLVKVRSGNYYPAEVWTRQGAAPGSPGMAGMKCADGKPEKTITVDVPANRAWTATGVSLNPCVEVRVEAAGFIEAAVGSDRGAFYRGVPPAGRGQFHSDKPHPSVFALSMVGRIGDGPVLPIGTFARWYAGPPYGSGELLLGINDDGLTDNSGSWKVRITTFGAAAPDGSRGTGGGGSGSGGGSSATACQNIAGTWSLSSGGTITLLDLATPEQMQNGKATTSDGREGRWQYSGITPKTREPYYTLFLVQNVYSMGFAKDSQRLNFFLTKGVGQLAYATRDCRVDTGANSGVVGQVQRVIPRGVDKPKVEEIPDDTSKDTGKITPRVESRPRVEEIPDDAVVPARNTGAVKKPQAVDKIEVEEIPDDEVVKPTTAKKPGATTSSNPPPAREQKPQAKNPGGGFLDNLGKAIGTAIKDANKPAGNQQPKGNPPPVYPPVQRQPAGGVWNLVSVTVSPETPARSGGVIWDYTTQGSSATYALYNGDKASFQWTRPPPQIDGNGFNVSVSVWSNPAPRSRLHAVISVSGSGLNTDAPSDQQGASAHGENGSPASDQKSVRFTPQPNASEIEVVVAFHWSVRYTYKYRRAQ